MSEPKIEHIGQLISDERNVRRHTPRNIGAIVDSLHEVGAARSIVIDETGKILAGNGTVEAAAEAGIERVRVIDADGEEIIAVRRRGLSDAQKKKVALYDNRSAELAEWDFEGLSGIIRELEEAGEALSRQNWADHELEPLLEANWTPPDEGDLPTNEPGAGGSHQIAFTHEQWAIVSRAIDQVRSANEEPKMPPAVALTAICEVYGEESDA